MNEETVEQQVQRLCDRLNSDDPDFDDCSEAARMLRWLADQRERLLERREGGSK